MHTGLLLGRDHTRLGAVAALGEGSVALALSRGGAAKRYDYQDPNEDACAFAHTPHASLLVVADGHWGSGGSARAVERLLERHAPRWLAPTAIALAERWSEEAPEVAADLNRLLVAAEREPSVGRTTLTLCLVRPGDGWWATLCAGDSHLFRVDGDVVHEHFPLAERERLFLGDPRIDRERITRNLSVGISHELSGCFVLATDGLSERGIGVDDPGEAVAASYVEAHGGDVALRPLALARGLAERANESHRTRRAGDNIATACLWLDGAS